MPSADRYGARHKAERKKWYHLVASGTVDCCLCGERIHPGESWDLDHKPGTTEYRGAAHSACNRRDGAVRGNQQRGKGARWVL